MRLPSLRKSRTRIALAGAMLSAAFLLALALSTRAVVRSTTFSDIDEELYTLAAALGSSFELEGLDESRRDTLRAGLEANAFEFRLANHSAILFKGETPVALSGNLLRTRLPGGIGPYRAKSETPYTAVEPYSGQNRVCRFLVTRLSGNARGATLVLFRWIGPSLHGLARLDRALAAIVLIGFIGTAAILAYAVTRAIRPVEEVTRLAEELEATDLSRRVRIASGGEEFRRLAAVINSLLDRLENAFRAQRRLIADAAHELKTPTAVLLGEAQEARRPDARPEETRQSLETIERAARGLAREVDGLLLLARGDAALPARREAVDLAGVAAEAVSGSQPLGAARGVRCRLEAREAALVSGDRAGLLRVASNLVANALQYTAAGSEVEVEVCRRREGNVVLEVRDRGPGVAPENRRRIFERFVRLDTARSHYPEGSGLGLAIVDQVVRAHGGEVEADQREGGGAVFRVTLPGASVAEPSSARPEAATGTSASG
jgi:two-component system, OmpR family, sensor kinase